MNQDNKTQGQNQSGKPQGQGREQMNERGNPSTTERIQPEPNKTGGQRPEGDNKPTGSQQPKF